MRWADAALAAALFAVDPAGIGGVALRALSGPARERWLGLLAELLPGGTPLRRLPLHATDGRLLGGLDLTATLRAGRPVAERGILAETDGGVVVAAMAERLSPATTARLAAVLDTAMVVLERDGLSGSFAARLGVVALDEGMADDERTPGALLDRLGFHLDLSGMGAVDLAGICYDRAAVAAARAGLPRVDVAPGVVEALCRAGMALGIGSSRAVSLALRVARASATLAGRAEVEEADLAAAGRLVLAPRATALPQVPEEEGQPEPPPDPAPNDPGEDTDDAPTTEAELPLDDLVLAAAVAAIPPDLLAQLRLGSLRRAMRTPSGRAGALRQTVTRGRPTGVRRGEPKSGARLNLVETLRAAAPWQPLRRRERGTDATVRLEVRHDDFRVTRFKQRTRTTTIFIVDASGSAALNRLAEAKGAVELVLADCYVRRDHVALLAFRGRTAELLLPPTRSLVRAKRSLAGLPGGGGTPLAAGIDAALALAEPIRRKGETPLLILLTDGRANVARDGSGGRERAECDAMAAARGVRAAGLTALVLDISPRPQPLARNVAAEMGARYLPLPHANAASLSAAVRAATPP
ncbi:MAG: magnesium chelatase subunit D [Geminicoccaceae bacterium]